MPTMRSPANLGHAEALRVGDFLEQNLRALRLAAGTRSAASRMLPSMMLSPRITQIFCPSAKCSASASASAMPPSPS